MTSTSFIWKNSSSDIYQLVDTFKNAFIEQNYAQLPFIFDSEFGFHNGYDFNSYIAHEMEEFLLKTEKFGLTKNATIQCYDIGYNFVYFSLGKPEELALFEAIFSFNPLTGKFFGNGYQFKIEPKMQFIQDEKGNVTYQRRINLTPALHQQDNKIHMVFTQTLYDDCLFLKSELPAHLGGNFYSLEYQLSDEHCTTFWDKLKIGSEQGIFTYHVLMRGHDHPIFTSNLFPVVSNETITISHAIHPVILYVLLEDGEEIYYKYPTEKSWSFDQPIQKVCLTDSLSFDWIVNLCEE